VGYCQVALFSFQRRTHMEKNVCLYSPSKPGFLCFVCTYHEPDFLWAGHDASDARTIIEVVAMARRLLGGKRPGTLGRCYRGRGTCLAASGRKGCFPLSPFLPDAGRLVSVRVVGGSEVGFTVQNRESCTSTWELSYMSAWCTT